MSLLVTYNYACSITDTDRESNDDIVITRIITAMVVVFTDTSAT